MGDVLALTHLFRSVQARFREDGNTTPHLFGWREPARREHTGNRIVWVPGDDEDGSMGEVTAARQPGRLPARSLGTLNELFTVRIWGSDPSAPEDELLQYNAARFLFDDWYRAAYLVALDTLVVTDTRWDIEFKERRFGACIRALCTIQAMLPDACATDATKGGQVTAEIRTGYSEAQETTDTFEGDGT